MDKWTGKHILTGLYLGLSHFGDGNISAEELQTLIRKVHIWDSENQLDETEKIVIDVYDWYVDESTKVMDRMNQLNDQIGKVPEMFNNNYDSLEAVLKDLVDIALSDGKLDDNERIIINEIAKAWDINFSV